MTLSTQRFTVKIKNNPVYVRRRRITGAIAVIVLLVLVLATVKFFGGDPSASAEAGDGAQQSASSATPKPTSKAPKKVEIAAPAVKPAAKQGQAGDSAGTSMTRIQRLTGDLTPKSVVASERGQVFAQNMMYSHTMSVFTADGALQKTIDDTVDLADFGVKGHPGTSKGSPVEMAFSPDGSTAWVSQYSMYGKGFLPEGADACTSEAGISNSYLYKVDTDDLKVTDVVEVGAVPKYVATSNDGSRVLVTNWCSMDLTVIDAKTAKVTATIPLGGDHPRGIAVSPDDKTAYVALMGDDRTVTVDLDEGTVKNLADTGDGPRHIVISPDGGRLYISNNGEGTVTEVDAKSGEVLNEVAVGNQPRSMAISPDGGALYVGNYGSSTVSKIRTKDFKVIQTEKTDDLPIGITYEPTKKRVWVASYGGSIIVFDDSRTEP